MKEIVKDLQTEVRKTFMLAKVSVTFLVLSITLMYHGLSTAVKENNTLGILFYSGMLIFQILVWIWSVFL